MRIARIVLFALVGLTFLGGPVSAEQQNRIIHAGDYDSFRVAPGRGWGACQRACNGDPRCKAWTFVKGTRQCRLKYMRGFNVKNNCCVSGGVTRNQGGQANRQRKQQRFCSNYAAKAVEVNEKNLSNRCRFKGRSWDADYTGHYQACLRISRAKANEIADDRKQMIDKCSSQGKTSRKSRCSHYVRITAVQVRTNQKAGCGFRGPRWVENNARHRRRCVNNTGAVTRDDTILREEKLRRCLGIR